MFSFKHEPLFFVLILVSCSALAGDVTSRCAWRLFNALNRLEVKGAAPLEIIEYKIDKPVDYIFGTNQLHLAPLETKFKERVAVFRNPHISRAVYNNVFEQTRFVSETPSENFASLLKDNTLYTYTIQDKKITFAQTRPGVLRDYVSKHTLLASDSKAGPIRMAGEMWKDEKGILHFDPGSRTYKPGAEDLKRAERFFKEHMGIKEAVVHNAHISVLAPAKSKTDKLVSQVKQLEIGQLAILNKRRVLAGYKMTVIKEHREKNNVVIEGEHIKLLNTNNKEVKYQVIRMGTIIREETLFDTIEMDLHKKQQQIIFASTFKKQDELKLKKKTTLSESEQAVIAARKSIGKAPLLPVAKVRTETEQYALVPVDAKGKLGQPVFIVSLDTKTSKGEAGKIKGKSSSQSTVMIEDLGASSTPKSKELEQLTNHLQKRFESGTPVSDRELGTISLLES